MTRHLLALTDLSAPEMKGLLTRAIELKALQAQGRCPQPLLGKTLAMIFEKASTRTRVSFEVGTYQLGGHALMLSKGDLQIGRGESVADTAKVLSRYVDGIMIRTFGHRTIEALAGAAEVPVINGLTDKLHPCQILADLQTIQEAFGAGWLKDLSVAWIGDGNNMAHSWINASAVLGFELRVASPDGYEPRVGVVDAARALGARLVLTRDPREAAAGARVVTTDVWASMGQEAEVAKREKIFAEYQVNNKLLKYARPDAIVLHCLPAHRGQEITDEVMDGPQAAVYDQAENRLHTERALLTLLLAGG